MFPRQAVHQLAKAAEQVDHGHQLEHGLGVQPQLLHRRSVDPESVVAPIHRRDGDCNDLFGQAVEFPLFDHDRLYSVAVRLQVVRVGDHGPVQVGDEIDPEPGFDLLIDLFDLAQGYPTNSTSFVL